MKTITATILLTCTLILGACSDGPVESDIENVYDRCYESWLTNTWCE